MRSKLQLGPKFLMEEGVDCFTNCSLVGVVEKGRIQEVIIPSPRHRALQRHQAHQSVVQVTEARLKPFHLRIGRSSASIFFTLNDFPFTMCRSM